MVHGARECKEPDIFVAIEETSERIVSNADSFGWKFAAFQQNKLFFMDTQPISDLVQAGDFDLGGMRSSFETQSRVMASGLKDLMA